MTSLQDLLPPPDEAPRCAEHGRAIGLDPGGTAFRADRVVVVPTTLPWPKPVFDHPALADVSSLRSGTARPTRVLAAVPPDNGHDGSVHGADGPLDHRNGGTTEVVAYDRQPDGVAVTERRFVVTDPGGLATVAELLAADDRSAIDARADSTRALTTPVAMICTQGSHDICCGSDGARFAAEAERVPGLVVHRVSHTGGHRFAPTGLTLPDGRMWADLDLDLLRRILWRTGEAADVAGRCRGWWGAAIGPAQVAERAVFERVGWELEDQARSVEVVRGRSDGDPAGASRCVVTVGGRRWEVVVVPGREVPTIACRQPGGRPAKPAREYVVHRIEPPAA